MISPLAMEIVEQGPSTAMPQHDNLEKDQQCDLRGILLNLFDYLADSQRSAPGKGNRPNSPSSQRDR